MSNERVDLTEFKVAIREHALDIHCRYCDPDGESPDTCSTTLYPDTVDDIAGWAQHHWDTNHSPFAKDIKAG